VSTEQASAQKHAGGAPKYNQNAKVHGLTAARRALNEYGLRAIDGRSALGVALRQFKAGLVADLGGLAALSTQQAAIVDVVCREKLLLDGLDMYILSQPSIVNKRNRTIFNVVMQRDRLANSFVQHLALLGLQKREAPKLTLDAYIAQKTRHDVRKRSQEGALSFQNEK